MPIVNEVSKIPTDKMVLNALKELAEKRGSSLYAIKKYISANYDVDMEKRIFHIKKYLRSALEKQELKSTSKGLNGRFKINQKIKKEKPPVGSTKTPLLPKLQKIPTSTPIVDANKKKKVSRKSLKKVLALKTSGATKRLSAGGKPRPKSVLRVIQETPKTAIFVKTPTETNEEVEKPTTSKKAKAAAKTKKISKKPTTIKI